MNTKSIQDIPRIQDRHKIDTILWDNAKRIYQPGWHFLMNANADSPELFEKANLRVLIMFLSDGEARSVSSTDLAIYTMAKQLYGDKIFMDFSYFPSKENYELFDELQIPWVFGMISHAPVKDFDVVFISNSVTGERHNFYVGARKSGWSPWANQRMQDTSLPVFVYGGAASSVASSMYGSSIDGSGKSLCEATYAGFAESAMDRLIDIVMKAKEEGWVKTEKRRLLDEFYQISCVFSPLDYEWVYEGKEHIKKLQDRGSSLGAEVNPIKDTIRLKEIKKINPKAHDRVRFARIPIDKVDTYGGFSHKILHSEGSFSSVDEIISWGCSSGGACTFCLEGNEMAWREVPMKKIVEKMKKAKSLSLADSYNSYSYNTPYHSELGDIMINASQIFDSLSAIAFRADVVAAQPAYPRMFKTLGSIRQTVAIEGVSDRIRNGYLNKNLFWDEIYESVRTHCELRYVQLKLFFILTGIEEQQDFDEWWAFFDKVLEARDRMGSKTSFVLSFTPLNCFHHTPLAYEPRASVINSIKKKRIMKQFIGQARDRGLRVRFSSSGKEPIYSQFIVDMGPKFTQVYEYLYETFGYVYSGFMPDSMVDAICAFAFKTLGLSYDELTEQRDYDFIFPDDLVEANYKSYLIISHKKLRDFEHQPMCLPNLAKTKSSGCIRCGMCESKEEIKYMQTHVPNKAKAGLEDVQMALSMNRARYRYRAVFDIPAKLAPFKKKAFAHYALANVYRKEADGISRIPNDPFYWAASNFPVHFHGKYFVDILSKVKLPTENLVTAPDSIMNLNYVKEVPLQSAIGVNDYAFFLVSLPYESEFFNKLSYKEHTIFPIDKTSRMGVKWSRFTDEKVTPPLSKVHNGRLYVFLDFPIKSNVVKHLSFPGCYSYRNLLGKLDVQVLGYYSRSQSKVCLSCRKNNTFYDILSQRISPYCPSCIGKVALSRLGASKQETVAV